MGALAADPHADGARRDIELLDLHGDGVHALMPQHALGEALGDRLDQLDMAAGEDHFDRVHDHVIGEDRAHVVGAVDAGHVRFDVEAHALRMAVFVSVGADLDRRDIIRRNTQSVSFAPAGSI